MQLFLVQCIAEDWKKTKCCKAYLKNENLSYLTDEPTTEDTYKRQHLAKIIVKKMCHTENAKHSFAVGITGSWGSGKTSFLELMKQELEISSAIIFDFKAWLCNTPDEIVVEFFRLFKENLSPYNPRIKDISGKYIEALVDLDNSNSVKALKRFFDNSSSAGLEYSRLSQEINRIDHDVFVFIDDLDRMSANEIMETLRLVRNTANFPKLYYILAYDKDYVVNTLLQAQHHTPERYLEKIINVEVPLSAFEASSVALDMEKKVRALIEKVLAEREPTRSKQKLEEDNQDINNAVSFLNTYITTIFPKNNRSFTFRDLKKFANSFSTILESFIENSSSEDISLRDMVVLELIKINYKNVYDTLKVNPAVFYEVKNKQVIANSSLIGTQQEQRFKSAPEKNVNDNNTNESRRHPSELILSQTEINDIISNELIRALVNNLQSNSISFAKNYDRYFSHRLTNEDIAYLEFFSNIYASNPKEKLKKWENDGKRHAIEFHLQTILIGKDIELKDSLRILAMYCKVSFEMKENPDLYYMKYLQQGFLSNILCARSGQPCRLYKNKYREQGEKSISEKHKELFENSKQQAIDFFKNREEYVIEKIAILLELHGEIIFVEVWEKLFSDLIMQLLQKAGDEIEYMEAAAILARYLVEKGRGLGIDLGDIQKRFNAELNKEEVRRNPKPWLEMLLKIIDDKVILLKAMIWIWESEDKFKQWLSDSNVSKVNNINRFEEALEYGINGDIEL